MERSRFGTMDIGRGVRGMHLRQFDLDDHLEN